MIKNRLTLLALSLALVACTPTDATNPTAPNNSASSSPESTNNTNNTNETAGEDSESPDANTIPASSDGTFRFISSTPREVIRSNRRETYHDLIFEHDEDLSQLEDGHFVRFINMRVYDASGDEIYEWKSSERPGSAFFVGSTINEVEGHLTVSEFAEQGITGEVVREIQATATETRFFEAGNRVALEIIYFLGQSKNKEVTVDLTL